MDYIFLENLFLLITIHCWKSCLCYNGKYLMLISPGKPTRNILPSSSETKNFSFYSFICEGTHFGQWIRPKLKQSYLLNLIILLLHYMTVFMVSQWTSTASWIHFYNLTLQTTIVDGNATYLWLVSEVLWFRINITEACPWMYTHDDW